MSQCKKCNSEISTDADKCPYCGYEPAKNGDIARRITLFVGFILTATVVGGVVGVPLIAFALYEQKQAKELKPTTHEPT